MTNKKAEPFISFIANSCSLINNSSTLPKKLEKSKQKRLYSISFSVDDIRKIDPDMAHHHGQVSIRMLKRCNSSICKLLEFIFVNVWRLVNSEANRKKPMVFPIRKNPQKLPFSLSTSCMQ